MDGIDKRRTVRVRAKGSVRVRSGFGLVRGRIHDVAVGGVHVCADSGSGVAELDGRRVRIDLRFDHGTDRWFALEGRVVRVAVATNAVVVAFEGIPTAYEACMQDRLLDAVEHDRLPHVILVDAHATRRATIAGTFRLRGCNVIEVATPLEAIVRLGELAFEPEVIAISDTFPVSIACELRAFVSATHPRARIVAIGGPRDDRGIASSTGGDYWVDPLVTSAEGSSHRSTCP